MVSDFIRVKGSGPFTVEEFCALTGLAPSRARSVLAKAQAGGLVAALGAVWLAYPLPPPKADNVWMDWTFCPHKVKQIYRLCTRPVPSHRLLSQVDFSQTALCRYLVAMESAGILQVKRQGRKKHYRQGKMRPLGTYRQELAQRRAGGMA
ncbi:MAG: hypothetical protein GX294_00080 [Candidatus Cloacimonetes bacterium]|nr:hypothetical protein [Candidatus Cloacimonadota bacterium]